MYLRTTKRKNKDGSEVKYYQLAHNERHPVTRKPVAKIIHSFGRADELEREQLVRLCNSIARVCGLQVFEPLKEAPLSEPAVWPQDLKLVVCFRQACKAEKIVARRFCHPRVDMGRG